VDPDLANVEEKVSIEAIEEVVPVVESNEDIEEEVTEEEVVSEPERSLVETGSQPNNLKTEKTNGGNTDFDWF